MTVKKFGLRFIKQAFGLILNAKSIIQGSNFIYCVVRSQSWEVTEKFRRIATWHVSSFRYTRWNIKRFTCNKSRSNVLQGKVRDNGMTWNKLNKFDWFFTLHIWPIRDDFLDFAPLWILQTKIYKSNVLLFIFVQGDGQLMKAVENELNKSIKRHLENGELFLSLWFCKTVRSFSA